MSENISDGITTTHYFVLCGFIFVFQFAAKLKENLTKVEEFPEEDRKKAHRLMLKYIFCFECAKAADWCLGPFVYEFFGKYHELDRSHIAKLQALSFTSNLLMGTFFVGYLNDKTNKKIPCLLFSAILSFSCLIRMFRGVIFLILSQVAFGCANAILYTSFENWLNAEAKITFSSTQSRSLALSSVFEK